MSDLKPPRVFSYFGAGPAEPAFFYCPFFGVNMTLICGTPFKTKVEISSGRIWIPRLFQICCCYERADFAILKSNQRAGVIQLVECQLLPPVRPARVAADRPAESVRPCAKWVGNWVG
jgi:hypothetical protein